MCSYQMCSLTGQLAGMMAREQLHAMPEDAQLNTDLATGENNDLKVKADGYHTLDTASHSPLGEPVPPAVLTLSASSLLDKLLARTRTVHQKLSQTN